MANGGSPNSTSLGLSVRHFSFRVGVDILISFNKAAFLSQVSGLT